MKKWWKLIALTLVLAGCGTVHRYIPPKDLSPIHMSITGILETSDNNVIIAPVATVSTSFTSEQFNVAGGNLDQWKLDVLNQLYAHTEKDLNKNYSRYSILKIMSRDVVEKALAELDAPGTLTDTQAAELGKTIGATLVLYVNVFRSPSDDPNDHIHVNDTYTNRLIDVETGQSLATESQKN